MMLTDIKNSLKQLWAELVIRDVAVGGATIAVIALFTVGDDVRTVAQDIQRYPTANTMATCYITSAATTNATNCKASVGNVYSYSLINTTATIYYLRMYNLAAAPTCSSATGFVETIPIPASTAGAGVQRDHMNGQAFSTGIGFCLTLNGASTDNNAAATGVYVTLLYK